MEFSTSRETMDHREVTMVVEGRHDVLERTDASPPGRSGPCCFQVTSAAKKSEKHHGCHLTQVLSGSDVVIRILFTLVFSCFTVGFVDHLGSSNDLPPYLVGFPIERTIAGDGWGYTIDV